MTPERMLKREHFLEGYSLIIETLHCVLLRVGVELLKRQMSCLSESLIILEIS